MEDKNKNKLLEKTSNYDSYMSWLKGISGSSKHYNMDVFKKINSMN